MDLFNELLAAFRGLIRRPATSLVAVLILALGLAAGVGVFTYVNGFGQAFPGVDARGLVQLFGTDDENPYVDVSYLDYVDYAEGSGDVFEGMAAVRSSYAASIRHEESTEVVFLEAVSGSYFPVLEVEMAAGRRLAPEDDVPGADPVAVISHAWWTRQWNQDPAVIGSIVHFNFRPYTVVGVAAPTFQGSLASYRPDAWLPFAPFSTRYTNFERVAQMRDVPLVRVHARLRDGVSRAQAEGVVERIAAGLDEAYPRAEGPGRGVLVEDATWIDPRARLDESATVRMMLAAAAALLLLVCANVGNLILAVALGRSREWGLRSALGASRGRLVRQVVLENVLLSGAAGVAALALAVPLSSRLGSFFARPSVWGSDVAREATLDGRVLLVAVAGSVLVGVLASILPAWGAGRRDVVAAIKGQGDAPSQGRVRVWGARAPGTRDALVSAQVGMAVVLLVMAGLVLRTLGAVGDIDPGFDHEPMLASYISTSSTGVQIEERDRYFRQLARDLTEEPWVRSASITAQAPLSPHGTMDVRLDGLADEVNTVSSMVVPGFFETVGIDVVSGRAFEIGDSVGAPEVAVVNQAMVRRYFADGTAVGREVWWPGADGADDRRFEIVGVVSDAKIRDFLAPIEPVVYYANPQHGYASGSALVVSATIEPALAVPRLNQWLRDYEPHIAIVNILPYTEVVRGFMYVQRMNAEMFSALAALGLVLAAVGIFSVMSLAVSRRTREIGIRMAMGARGDDIGRLVLRRVVVSVFIGLVAGLGVSFALTGLLEGLLYDVAPTDGVSLAGGVGVLLAAAVLATLMPVYRATTVDPIHSLKSD